MTTPPKVRRFHLSASESPVAAAREAARATTRPKGETAAPAGAEPARSAVRVEVRKGGARTEHAVQQCR